MPTPESEILKPKDVALKDDNDWEEFQLTNVEVRNPSDGSIASLLQADAVSPVAVVGRLEPVTRDRGHLLHKPQPRAIYIELSSVTRYAYGQYDDGEVAVWAAGEAGWFKLETGRNYRETFEDMVEAIKLLYFFADIYGGSRVTKGSRSATAVFKRYAKENPEEYANADDVAEAVSHHREFLILSMLRGNELQGAEWRYTDVFLHLKSKHPEDYKAMVRKKEGKIGPSRNRKAKSSPSQTSQATSQEPETADDAPSRGAGRQKANDSTSAATANGAPKKDSNWWEAKVVWEMMQRAQIQGLVSSANMTIESFAKIMVRRYEVDDETLAANYIRAHAQNLMHMMSHKRRPAVQWVEQSVYSELASSRLSATILKKVSELKIRQRIVPLPDPEPMQVDTETSSSEDDVREIGRRARRGRSSILRPKGSKFSSKGMTRSGKSYHRSSGDEDDDTDVPEAVTSPSKRKGDSNADRNTRRKRITSRGQIPQSPPDSEEERARKEQELPLRWKTPVSVLAGEATPLSRIGTPGTGFAPSIITETPASAMSREANSPGDVWKCGFDGCMFKVYGASTDLSQGLIAEHLDGHDEARKERVELARSIELESNLPVSNLIKRIRDMADAQQSTLQMGLAGSASSGPQPIRRLY